MFENESLKLLLELSKEIGYLTYGQVSDFLPDDADSEKIDELLIILEEQGIELIDASASETQNDEMEEAADSLRSLQRKLNSQRNRLRQVRLCQSMPASERILPRSELFWDCGYVYLLWCKRDAAHKIGKCRELRKRKKALQQQHRYKRHRYGLLTAVASYPTIVFHGLENALHTHFRRFHYQLAGTNELFKLPAVEVDRFQATAVELEQFVLSVTVARLELDIRRLEMEVVHAHSPGDLP